MRLCFLSYMLSMGGFTSSLLPLIRQLLENNIDVDLMLFEKNDEITIDVPGLTIFYNNTPKTVLSKFQKALFMAKIPGFLFSYLRSRFDRRAETQRQYGMTFCQALLKANTSEYVEKCDLTKYDCVISWEELFPNYFLAEKVLAKRKIGYIHPDYQRAAFNPKIDIFSYSKLDFLCFVSQATQKSFCDSLPTLSDKTRYIPNVLDVKSIRFLAHEVTETYKKSNFDIVSVCRLDNTSKALGRAAHIAKRLKQSNLDFKWYFIGDGHGRQYLETLINEYNIQDRMILVGAKTNPHPFTKNSDLFVLQSNYEGRPLSVDEALIIGTPVLISNFLSAHEQVQDNITGYIAENNEDAIFDKIKWVIENKQDLEKIRSNITKENVEKYKNTLPLLQLIKGD